MTKLVIIEIFYWINLQFSKKLAVAANMVSDSFYDDGEMYVLTVYFTDPNHVCDGENNRPKGIVGDELNLQVGVYEYMKVPLLEKELASTKWVKGKCFFGMGK